MEENANKLLFPSTVTVCLLLTFAISLWHWKFVTLAADLTAVFDNSQRGIWRRGQDNINIKFTFEGVHSREVDRQISWEKLDKKA